MVAEAEEDAAQEEEFAKEVSLVLNFLVECVGLSCCEMDRDLNLYSYGITCL